MSLLVKDTDHQISKNFLVDVILLSRQERNRIFFGKLVETKKLEQNYFDFIWCLHKGNGAHGCTMHVLAHFHKNFLTRISVVK